MMNNQMMSPAMKIRSRSKDITRLVESLVSAASSSEFPLHGPQTEYMNNWLNAITSSADRFEEGDARTGIVMSSADTGTGKTIGYALPLMAVSCVTGHPVAIATHTHALQRQMANPETGDLALINQWLVMAGERPLLIAVRMGKQAFVSCTKIFTTIDRLQKAGDTMSVEWLEDLMDWSLCANRLENSGLIDDAVAEIGEMPPGVSPQSICLSSDSGKADRACYDAHIELSERADVVLMTHHYLSAMALYGKNNRFAALVIDEADRIASVISSMMHHDLSLRNLHQMLKSHDGYHVALGHMEDLISAVTFVVDETGEGQGGRAVATCALSPRAQNSIMNPAINTLAALGCIIDSFSSDSAGSPALDADARDFMEEIKRSAKVLELFIKPSGFWVSALCFSPVRGYPSIVVMPMNPAMLLRELWKDEQSPKIFAVMMTSATLGTPGIAGPEAFKNIAGEMGISEKKDGEKRTYQVPLYEYWGQYEPLIFGKMKFVLSDPSISSPVQGIDEEGAILNQDWLAYAARMIVQAHQSGGRTLVLTRSYSDCESLAPILPEMIGDDKLIVQKRGRGMRGCQKQYEETAGAVWLSPSAWEGINMPGKVQNLVMLRLPLQRDDPVRRALLLGVAKLKAESVENIISERRTLNAKRLMRQGIGRGIRRHNDKCTVWIADPRLIVPQNNKYLLSRTGYLLKQLKEDNPHRVKCGHNYLIGSIPARFQSAITRTDHPPLVFWADGFVQ